MASGYQSGLSVPKRYPARYRDILIQEARRYHIPARVLAAQEFVESSYSPDVISGRRKSSAGAYGISQFIASTGRSYGVRPGTSRAAVRTQVHGHAKYLNALGASQDLRHAIASYAGGPGNPQYGYAQRVLSLAKSYRGVGKGRSLSGRLRSRGGGSRRTVATIHPAALPSGGTGLADLLATQVGQRPIVAASPPPEPLFSARAKLALPSGYAAPIVSNGAPVSQGVSLSDQLRAVREAVPAGGVPKPTVTKNTTIVKGQKGGQPTVGPRGKPVNVRRVKGTASFEGHTVAGWIAPWLRYARKHGWKGTISSGFRSYQDQVRIYNSGIRPAARPGTSNHEGANFPRGAVDVSDAATLDRILRRAGAPLKWAGAKDPVHFSFPHGGGY